MLSEFIGYCLIMTCTLADFDTLYDALTRKDPEYDGVVFVCVKTTGIVCRPICPARTPYPHNLSFVGSLSEAHAAGFRNCKRCKPEREPDAEPDLVKRLKSLVAAETENAWKERDLEALSMNPATVRRQFKAATGQTFAQYVRDSRLSHAKSAIENGETVIMAQQDAGYGSASGFRGAFAKQFGSAPNASKAVQRFVLEFIDTPLGVMIAVADDEHLHILEFSTRKNLEQTVERYRSGFNAAITPGSSDALSLITREVGDYFAGREMGFNSVIAPAGTEFQNTVWAALRATPFGETRSYAQLAQEIGNPKAVRAVANANGQNRCAIILPCHRIIGSDGTLTGYAGGLEKKRWLLDHERKVRGDTLL